MANLSRVTLPVSIQGTEYFVSVLSVGDLESLEVWSREHFKSDLEILSNDGVAQLFNSLSGQIRALYHSLKFKHENITIDDVRAFSPTELRLLLEALMKITVGDSPKKKGEETPTA